MTFEQFQATRQHSDDIGRDLPDSYLENSQGYIYEGGLHIEDTAKWPDAAKKNNGAYCLTIGNAQTFSDEIETLERALYDYAVREELI